MKRALTTFCVLALAVVCLLALPTRAEAATVASGKCGANLTWTLDDQGTLTISGTGKMNSYKNSTRPWETQIYFDVRKIVIMSGVTEIGDNAFAYANGVTEVSIANTVTKIGAEAFFGSTQLQTITIPAGVTEIGDRAIEGVALEKIVVNASNPAYCSDSQGVLYNKQKTVLIKAPTKLSGSYAVPATVRTIKATAFRSCDITAVTGMSGVTTLGEGAFSDCQYLKSFAVPAGVVELPDSLLGGCCSLQKLTIHANVTWVSSAAYDNCNSLTSVEVDSNNQYYSSDSRGVLFDKNKATLIKAPGGLSGTYTIPKTVTAIGGAAFSNCEKVEEVVIPEGVTRILNYVFWGCTNLKTIHIPASVNRYGNGVLDHCTALEFISVAEDNTVLSNDAQGGLFSKDKSILLEIPKGMKGIYIVPSGTQMIQSYAFANSPNLEGVIIPEGVTVLSNGAFMDCAKLKFVALPTSVTYIDQDTFRKMDLHYDKLTDIYYAGTKAQWESISIDPYENEPLFEATIHYNSVGPELCITKQPVMAVVASGATAKVRVTAIGVGLSYAWYYNDGNGFLKSSITTDTYTAQMNNWRSGRKVYCVVSDALGRTVQTETVTLYMGNPAKITVQPKNAVAANNTKVTTSLTATGDGLKYAWYYKNAGATTWSKSSLTGNAYYVTMKSTTKGRQVYCVVTDKYGTSVKSNVVTLYMGNPAKITVQPKNAYAANGAQVKTSLTATGDGLKYAWYFRNAGATTWSKSSLTGNSYYVTMKAATKGRQVYCLVTDKYGTSVKSDVVTLHMGNPAKITTQPGNGAAPNGQKVTVSLTATGDGLKYAWYFRNAGATAWSKSSLTGNSYYVTMKATTKGRQVYCVVTDKYGNSVKSDVVTLYMGNPAKITTQPKSVTVANGKQAKTTIKATGDGLTYTWYFRNAGATAWSKSSLTGNSYYVTMKSTTKGRQVYCVVTDKYGNSVKSNVVTLNMK